MNKGFLKVDMTHFFIQDYLAKIEHPTLKSLLDQLLADRRVFFSTINNNIVEFSKPLN